MSRTHGFLVLALALTLVAAGPALAGNGKKKKGSEETIVNEALSAMAAGTNTLAGPGHFEVQPGGSRQIYEIVSGAAPDVCVTVRNRGVGRVRLIVIGEAELDRTPAGVTETHCFAAPMDMRMRCQDSGRMCSAVWRIDRN